MSFRDREHVVEMEEPKMRKGSKQNAKKASNAAAGAQPWSHLQGGPLTQRSEGRAQEREQEQECICLHERIGADL